MREEDLKGSEKVLDIDLGGKFNIIHIYVNYSVCMYVTVHNKNVYIFFKLGTWSCSGEFD